MSSCEAIVMCDYKFLTKMYKYLSKLFAKSVQRIHKPYRLPDVAASNSKLYGESFGQCKKTALKS